MTKILPAGVRRGAEVLQALLDSTRESEVQDLIVNNTDELEALVDYILGD